MAHDGRKRAASAAAALLASGETVTATATKVNVSVRTLHRWKKNPKFRRLVNKLRADMVSAASGKLADGMAQAADTLRGLLADPDSAVKMRAATKVIELSVLLREFDELEKRVQELERMALTKGGG